MSVAGILLFYNCEKIWLGEYLELAWIVTEEERKKWIHSL
jgi:hypothetical protein